MAHAQLIDKVTFIKEKAQDAIDDLDTPFDFIFIDHAKKRYLPDLLLLEKAGLVKKDTIVFADNVGLPLGACDWTDSYHGGFQLLLTSYLQRSTVCRRWRRRTHRRFCQLVVLPLYVALFALDVHLP